MLLLLTGFLSAVFTLLPNDTAEVVYLVLSTISEKVIVYTVLYVIELIVIMFTGNTESSYSQTDQVSIFYTNCIDKAKLIVNKETRNSV